MEHVAAQRNVGKAAAKQAFQDTKARTAKPQSRGQASLGVWQKKLSSIEAGAATKGLSMPKSQLVFRMNPLQRHEVVSDGVPAAAVADIAGKLGTTSEKLNRVLGLGSSTVARKVSEGKNLDLNDGERILQMYHLQGLVHEIAQDFIMPEQRKDFDADKWLGEWLEIPQPSLNNRKPSEFLHTDVGMQIVETLLKRIAVGAFA